MKKEMSAGYWAGAVFAGIIAVALIIMFAGWIVYLLWPMAIKLGLPAITYWESVGLYLLTSMLFKTFDINQVRSRGR